jgi:L-lactate dehydrogenase (cytochrome)
VFDDASRAVLAYTDAMTREVHVPDAVFRRRQSAFRRAHDHGAHRDRGRVQSRLALSRSAADRSRITFTEPIMPDTDQPIAKPLASAEAYRHSGARAEPDKSLPRNLRMMLALDDFEAPARRYLPRPMYGYVSGGAETNASLRANRAAFDDYAFVPRALVDVSGRSTKTTLFGQTYNAPFGFAPMGGSSMAAYHGDIVLARSGGKGEHSDDHERRFVVPLGRRSRGRAHRVVPGLFARRNGPDHGARESRRQGRDSRRSC